MVRNVKNTQLKRSHLPIPAEVRVLADEALALGEYGTLTNTIKVALRDQIQRLKARNQQLQNSAA